MPVHFASPSKILAPYIKGYRAIENVPDKGERCVQRMIPTGLTELLLYFSHRPDVLNSNKYLSGQCGVVWTSERFLRYGINGKFIRNNETPT